MNKKIIGYVITIVILLGFGLYAYFNPSVLEPIFNIQVVFLILLVLTKLAALTTRGFFYQVLLKSYDKSISLFQGFFAAFITTFGNYFLPLQSGMGLRAIYFKKRFKFSYDKFVATISGIFIITFLINSLVGLLVLLYLAINQGKFSPVMFTFFVGIFIFTLILSLIKLPRFLVFVEKLKIRSAILINIMTKLDQIVEGWHQINQNRGLLVRLVGVFLIDFLVTVIQTLVLFRSIGVDIDIVGALLYSAISSVSIIVTITPGAIGIKEAVFVLFAEYIGITTEQILSTAVIDRGILFAFLLFLFLIFRTILPEETNFISKGTEESTNLKEI